MNQRMTSLYHANTIYVLWQIMSTKLQTYTWWQTITMRLSDKTVPAHNINTSHWFINVFIVTKINTVTESKTSVWNQFVQGARSYYLLFDYLIISQCFDLVIWLGMSLLTPVRSVWRYQINWYRSIALDWVLATIIYRTCSSQIQLHPLLSRLTLGLLI